jgi:hypothetical protein
LRHMVRALFPVLQVLDDSLHRSDRSSQKVADGRSGGSAALNKWRA